MVQKPRGVQCRVNRPKLKEIIIKVLYIKLYIADSIKVALGSGNLVLDSYCWQSLK